MITVITNSTLLDVSAPCKMFEHNVDDGVVIDDLVLSMTVSEPPNSRTIIDKQKLWLKIEYNRTITIYYQQPSGVDFNSFSNTNSFSEWKKSRVYVMNTKVLVHKYDAHPDSEGAAIQSKDGYNLETGDVMYACIDQNSGQNNFIVWY